MIRVLFDANVIISYLLTGDRSGPVAQAVDLVGSAPFQVIWPSALRAEIATAVAESSYLVHRISPERLDRFLTAFERFATAVPADLTEFASVSRDEDDNYLIAFALAYDVDYLVSGDKHILKLRHTFARPNIRSPREFVDELASRRLAGDR